MVNLEARDLKDHRLVLPSRRAAWTLILKQATSRKGNHDSTILQARDLNIEANVIEEGNLKENDLDKRAASTSRCET